MGKYSCKASGSKLSNETVCLASEIKKMSEVLFLRGFEASEGEAGLQTVRDAENAAVAT